MDHFSGFDALLRVLLGRETAAAWSGGVLLDEETFDAVYHPENAAAIVELGRDADWLFLEATVPLLPEEC